MKKEKGKIVFEYQEELPLTAMSFETTQWNHTGSWKYLEPYYQDFTPPCVARCLSKTDIASMMRFVEESRWEDAVQTVLQTNPYPAITGRVCPHPCEQPCNRKAFGGGVSIRAVECAVGDYKLKHNIVPKMEPEKYPKVSIIGSGPAGISAAYYLRTLGHSVVVYEQNPLPGGLLRLGIPSFRLPMETVDAEIEWLKGLGIQFETNHKIHPSEIDSLGPTVLAFGYSRSRSLGIPGESLPKIYDGVALLRAFRLEAPVHIGNRVAIIGGGNTALDIARSLRRLGASPTIYYRRTQKEMPAFKEEITQATQEGIELVFLVAPVRVEPDTQGGLTLWLNRMELKGKDSSGRPKPEPVEGSEFPVSVDAIVKALGETLEMSDIPQTVAVGKGNIRVDEEWKTTHDLTVACGDCTGVMGNTVSEAIYSGRASAFSLYETLTKQKAPLLNVLDNRGASEQQAKFKELNMAYFEKESALTPSLRGAQERATDFAEVEGHLSEQDAVSEAARCFKCGTCIECDNCFHFCPDLAIVRQEGGGYEINFEYCKGCGVCVEECPRQAIHLRRST